MHLRSYVLSAAVAAAAIGGSALLPVVTSAAPLPGTTIGDYCTSYKHIPYSASSPSEDIDYQRCNDGTTVKIVTFIGKGGDSFQYIEFRDALGNLSESRFGRDPDFSNPASPPHIDPLADSVSP
jgi:hypothetical protein